MPWVLYQETEGDCGEGSHTETEVLAVVSDPETVRQAIPDETAGKWPLVLERECHRWRYDESDKTWVYSTVWSSWCYVLRELALDDLSGVKE